MIFLENKGDKSPGWESKSCVTVSLHCCMPCKMRGDTHLFQLSNLFQYAHGDVRCVRLYNPLEDFFFCIADVIRGVSGVGSERASEIWRFHIKKQMTDLPVDTVSEYTFHRSAVPVATFLTLVKIVCNLVGKNAVNFRALHPELFSVESTPVHQAIYCHDHRLKLSSMWPNVVPAPLSQASTVSSPPLAPATLSPDNEAMCVQDEDEDTNSMECDPVDDLTHRMRNVQTDPEVKKSSYTIRERTELISSILAQYKEAQEIVPNATYRDQICAKIMESITMLPSMEVGEKRASPLSSGASTPVVGSIAASSPASNPKQRGTPSPTPRVLQSIPAPTRPSKMYTTRGGSVYCLVSDAYPTLVKIGRSKNVEQRLSALNTGCAPMPLRVAAAARTFDAVRDEKLAHSHFALVRAEGEYFRTTVDEVKEFFQTQITPVYIQDLEMLVGI